ncbi:MAG: S-layer homology domain-containing protein [Clostridiaceae bacterium]|nr:S-layer homology domain-containing protein [Clostridiaceae bacterium]
MKHKFLRTVALFLAMALALAVCAFADVDESEALNSDYIPRTITVSGVTVEGDQIHDAARLLVSETLHNASICEVCKAFRALQDEGHVLLTKNVTLTFGFHGSITVTFPVDTYYNGLEITVAHCNNQTLEYENAVVKNGKVSMSVTKLSPFVVFDGIYDPETGTVTKAEQPEPEVPPRKNPFTDVAESDWFYDDVLTAYEQKWMTGTARDAFAPDGTATRAMLATCLYRLAGNPPVYGVTPFSDVDMHEWYANAVLWASEEGIVQGDGNGRFLPGQAITRAELAAMLYRYAQWEGRDVSASAYLSYFPDGYLTPVWARTALSWTVAEGIITGNADSTLDPMGDAARAEIAAMLRRFAGK